MNGDILYSTKQNIPILEVDKQDMKRYRYVFVQISAKMIELNSMRIFFAVVDSALLTVHLFSDLSSRKISDANLNLEGIFVHSSEEQPSGRFNSVGGR